jgi:hypothetical protein
MLDGGKVIAEALVSGTPGVGVRVCISVDVSCCVAAVVRVVVGAGAAGAQAVKTTISTTNIMDRRFIGLSPILL